MNYFLKEIKSGPKVERNQILYILRQSPNNLVQRLFIGDESWKPITLKFDDQLLKDVIYEAISRKPKGHDFVIERNDNENFVPRHMNITGG